MIGALDLDLRYLAKQALNKPSKELFNKLTALERQVKGSVVQSGLCELTRSLLGKPSREIRGTARHLLEEVELGLIALCMGNYSKAVNLGKRLLAYDSTFGVKQAEESFDPIEYLGLKTVLFKALKKLTGQLCFDTSCSVQLSPYAEAVSNYLQEHLPTMRQDVQIDKAGVASFSIGELKGLFSLEGIHGGFGSVEKDNVCIRSMGPHFFPLGVSDLFGLYRTKDSFEDVEIKEEPFAFKGWARAANTGKPSDLWIDVQAKQVDEKLSLGVKFFNFTDFTPLAMTFFVKANKVVVNPFFEVYPQSLERYQGQQEKLTFNDGALTLVPQFQGEMQVIPLAGGPYFWGSDFLIAFAITEEMQTYNFDVL